MALNCLVLHLGQYPIRTGIGPILINLDEVGILHKLHLI